MPSLLIGGSSAFSVCLGGTFPLPHPSPVGRVFITRWHVSILQAFGNGFVFGFCILLAGFDALAREDTRRSGWDRHTNRPVHATDGRIVWTSEVLYCFFLFLFHACFFSSRTLNVFLLSAFQPKSCSFLSSNLYHHTLSKRPHGTAVTGDSKKRGQYWILSNDGRRLVCILFL